MQIFIRHILLLLFCLLWLIYEIGKTIVMFFRIEGYPVIFIFLMSMGLTILLLLFYLRKVEYKPAYFRYSIKMLFIFKSLMACFFLYIIFDPIRSILDITHLSTKKIIMFLSFDNFFENISAVLYDKNICYFYLQSVFIAPIIEEILFRGLLQQYLYKIKIPFVAIFLAALLFSLFHFNVDKIFITFFPGLFYGFIYYKSGRLIMPIICHSFWNILCILLPKTIQDISAFTVLFFIIALLSFILVLRNIWKSNTQQLHNE